MLSLPTEATTEQKMDACSDQRSPTYHRSPQIIPETLDSLVETYIIINTKDEKGTGNLEQEGVFGSSTSATIALNLHHSWTLNLNFPI